MSDEKLRDLERRAKSGDPAARERYLREKTRVGQPLYMADVLAAAGFNKAALSSVAKGVRAVCKLARIDVRVSIWRDTNDAYVYTQSESVFHEITRKRFVVTFGINPGPLYHTHREDRSKPDEEYWHHAGPTLKPEHQEAFLAAVRASEAKAPSRKPVGRAFQVNDVVTLQKPGARRRYVVSRVGIGDGKLVLVALSGSFRTGAGLGVVTQELVSLDHDQEIFHGADSGKLSHEYRRQVGDQAFRSQP